MPKKSTRKSGRATQRAPSPSAHYAGGKQPKRKATKATHKAHKKTKSKTKKSKKGKKSSHRKGSLHTPGSDVESYASDNGSTSGFESDY